MTEVLMYCSKVRETLVHLGNELVENGLVELKSSSWYYSLRHCMFSLSLAMTDDACVSKTIVLYCMYQSVTCATFIIIMLSWFIPFQKNSNVQQL